MIPGTTIDHSYSNELTEDRRLCDPAPNVHVRLIENVCLECGEG